MQNVGAKLSVQDFLDISSEGPQSDSKINEILTDLEDFVNSIGYKKKYNNNLDAQRTAWKKQIIFLAEKFKYFEMNPDLCVLFEYMLPNENTRRPDVILLFEEKVISLEFKTSGNIVTSEYATQFVGYGDTFNNHHQYTILNNLQVESYLIMSSTLAEEVKLLDDVNTKFNVEHLNRILAKDSIDQLFVELAGHPIMTEKALKGWIDSERGRSKKVWEKALTIRDALINNENGSLSRLSGITYENLREADELIQSIIDNSNEKNLIFVSGVPGAGKTLIGLLQLFRYLGNEKDTDNNIENDARYYTGNGALVDVLSKTTESDNVTIFTNYRRQHILNKEIVTEKVLIFDEAQRFWSASKAGMPISDAKGIINANHKGPITVIALIGDGQIPLDGEAGIDAWVDALCNDTSWEVSIPTSYNEIFPAKANFTFYDELHLNTSVRSNFVDIAPFIEAVLNANLDEAKKQFDIIKKEDSIGGIKIKICRDLKRLYQKQKDGKTVLQKVKDEKEDGSNNPYLFGILCSSKTKVSDLEDYSGELISEIYQKNNQAYDWYTGKCCDVNPITVGTETFCQGLELDLPIVFFGGDYYLKEKNGLLKWQIELPYWKEKTIPKDKREKILKDTYRILLTRVTNDMMIIIPDKSKFAETYEFFKNIGLEEWP